MGKMDKRTKNGGLRCRKTKGTMAEGPRGQKMNDEEDKG